MKFQKYFLNIFIIIFVQPVTGVEIKFTNGLIKQGGEIKKENRMRKSEYKELVEN